MLTVSSLLLRASGVLDSTLMLSHKVGGLILAASPAPLFLFIPNDRGDETDGDGLVVACISVVGVMPGACFSDPGLRSGP